MEALIKDFFKAWEDEIAAYQEVALILGEQKSALVDWDIKKFQKVSQEAALLISNANKSTNFRHDLMETLIVTHDLKLENYSLKNIFEVFYKDEEKEKSSIFFKVFSNTLKQIDKFSAQNKELIRTGLELVGENLEMIADIIDKDRVYSRVGMIQPKRNAILLNKRI